MPNDAKLGLLAGVLGVVIAAVVSVNRPQQPASAAPASPTNAAPTPTSKPTPELRPTASPQPAGESSGSPASPAVLPADLGSTPVVRTKKEPTAIPASRPPSRDADIEP